jgi:hypothetical protein
MSNGRLLDCKQEYKDEYEIVDMVSMVGEA